eukprot:3041990-Amphidinium_carterae.1
MGWANFLNRGELTSTFESTRNGLWCVKLVSTHITSVQHYTELVFGIALVQITNLGMSPLAMR